MSPNREGVERALGVSIAIPLPRAPNERSSPLASPAYHPARGGARLVGTFVRVVVGRVSSQLGPRLAIDPPWAEWDRLNEFRPDAERAAAWISSKANVL